MSYGLKNEEDPKWLLPVVLLIIIGGLVWWGVSASVKYVEEEGYEEQTELTEYTFGFAKGDTLVKVICASTKADEFTQCMEKHYVEGGNGMTLPNGEEQYQYVADEVIVK